MCTISCNNFVRHYILWMSVSCYHHCEHFWLPYFISDHSEWLCNLIIKLCTNLKKLVKFHSKSLQFVSLAASVFPHDWEFVMPIANQHATPGPTTAADTQGQTAASLHYGCANNLPTEECHLIRTAHGHTARLDIRSNCLESGLFIIAHKHVHPSV